MGPFLFSLGLTSASHNIPAASFLGRWYLDDSTFVCTLQEADAILRELTPKLQSIGLTLNEKKTTLWGPGLPLATNLDHLPADSPLRKVTITPYTPTSCIQVMGVPITPPNNPISSIPHLSKATQSLRDISKVIKKLQDKQIAHHVI